MTAKLCFSLLAPLFLGLLLIHILLPKNRFVPGYRILKLSLAVGLGFGITSCTYFLSLLTIGPRLKGIIIYDVGLFVVLVLMFILYARTRIASENEGLYEKTVQDPIVRRILYYGFYSTLLLSCANFIHMVMRLPHGEWDCWAIWNMRARFIFRGGEYWADTFSSLLAPHQHPDYPLLVPLSVSRCWTYIGKEMPAASMWIAFLFTFAIIGVLYSAFAFLKSKSQGILASLILLGTSIFIILGTFQYADVPIGFFFLASFVLISLQDRFSENYGLSFLAGSMAGFAGWTKNEGLLFLLSLFIARLLATFFAADRRTHMKQLLYFTLGSIPVLAIILYFKVNLAPSGDLLSGTRGIGEIVLKIKDLSRYTLILKAFLVKSFITLPYILLLIFYPLIMGIKIDDNSKLGIITCLIVLSFMVSGYMFIYLITPYDLAWHIESSLARLLVQLWPSVLFVYFMIVRTPEEALMCRRVGVNSELYN
jgi:hypothetical protein